MKNARARHAKLLFLPTKSMQICDILVAVPLSLLKFPIREFKIYDADVNENVTSKYNVALS